MTNDDLQEKLKQLNAAVDAAIGARRKFLDDNQSRFAEFQIGDRVYNVQSGQHGTVVAHYRYWTTQNKLLDKSFDVHCQIQYDSLRTTARSIDNTSRFTGANPFVLESDREQNTQHYQSKLEVLVRRFD